MNHFKIGDMVEVLPHPPNMTIDPSIIGQQGTINEPFGRYKTRHGWVAGYGVILQSGREIYANPNVLRLIPPPDDSRQLTTWDSNPLLRQIRHPGAVAQIAMERQRIELEGLRDDEA